MTSTIDDSLKYTFTSEETIIRLIWYNIQFTSCLNMFYYYTYITKVDLSKFDSSKVVTTNSMFYQCQNLKEINLTNFDTSSLTDMANMFKGCNSLTSIDVSSFDTSKVENMNNLFAYNYELISVDLSNFNTSKVTDMRHMFFYCFKLNSINFSNFDTKSVKTFNSMFRNCQSLTSIDISHFDTSSATDLNAMFDGCENLESINLQNIDTSKTTNLNGMFYGCSKLTSLNLSSFDMSNAQTLQKMFYGCENLQYIEFNNIKTLNSLTDVYELFSGCKSLKSLDLSFMDISKVTNMESVFYGCENLKYLNLSSFDTSSINNMISTFDGCTSLSYINFGKFVESDNLNLTDIFNNIGDNLIICIEDVTNAQNIISLINEKNIVNDCSNLCFSENAIYNLENNTCSGDCSNNNELYKYKYNNNCISSCNNYLSYNQKECIDTIPEGYYLNSSSLKTIDKCPDKCSLCSDESMKNSLCISCNSNYYKLDLESYVNCYSNCPEGYINFGNICDIYIEITTEIPTEKSTELLTDELTEIYSNIICDDKLYILIENNLCIDECSSIDFLNHICKEKNNSLLIKEEIINRIKEDITSGNLNDLLENVTNNDKKDIEIFESNIIYQITSTFNQENYQYDNISVIKLLECENRLKIIYNITKNMSLIILKIDTYEEGLLMPKVEYEVYHPLTFEKLELYECSNISIEIDVPVSIDEDELFKYDPTSDFYNDKCFPYTSENGTDVTLNDRKNEFLDNNLTLCENNCQYMGYDKNTKYATCYCETKNYINITNNNIIDKDRLLKSFIDIKNMINLEVIKCYYVLFKKDSLIKNIGSYILLFCICFFIISLIIFIVKGYKSLINQINMIIPKNKNKKKLFQTEIGKTKKFKVKKKVKKKRKKKDICITERNILKTKNKSNYKEKNKNTNYPPKKRIRHKKKYIGKSSNNIFQENDTYNSIVKPLKRNLRHQSPKIQINKKANDKKVKTSSINLEILGNKSEKNHINKIIPKFNDTEINLLLYSEALMYDKRSYFQYYLSLIRTKHMFVFAFYPNNDYNSQIIKISLFLFSFVLYYTINALFFTDDTIHEIYESSGKFDFIYQLPQILYSTLISAVINTTIKYFSLSEKNILKIKEEVNINNYNIEMPKVIKCLKIKFIIFYILSFIFLLFFWFYLSCFCAVYINTQICLIEDTLLSFGLSLLYPFGLYLLPGFFRIPSLKAEKKDKKGMYDFSKILQLI